MFLLWVICYDPILSKMCLYQILILSCNAAPPPDNPKPGKRYPGILTNFDYRTVTPEYMQDQNQKLMKVPYCCLPFLEVTAPLQLAHVTSSFLDFFHTNDCQFFQQCFKGILQVFQGCFMGDSSTFNPIQPGGEGV